MSQDKLLSIDRLLLESSRAELTCREIEDAYDNAVFVHSTEGCADDAADKISLAIGVRYFVLNGRGTFREMLDNVMFTSYLVHWQRLEKLVRNGDSRFTKCIDLSCSWLEALASQIDAPAAFHKSRIFGLFLVAISVRNECRNLEMTNGVDPEIVTDPAMYAAISSCRTAVAVAEAIDKMIA